jgi:hypothetical protein
MYKLGERSHHKQKLYVLLIFILAGLIMAGWWAANKYLQPETTLGDSEGVVRHVDVVKPATKQVNNSIFSMTIPRNWQPVKSSRIPSAQYAWRATSKTDAGRGLEIYVDAIPKTMAVNRLLPVSASNNRLVIRNEVSDNCVNFTDASKADRPTGQAPAKWSGVNFYCDVGNYARNVVGTGSPSVINSVTVDGSAAGAHRFFFVYTDHSAESDYVVFTDILSSFRVH